MMNTLPPLPYSFHEPIPVGEVTERTLMPFEASLYPTETIAYSAEESRQAALLLIDIAEAMCPGFTDECRRTCMRQAYAAMDDVAQFCDAGRVCK